MKVTLNHDEIDAICQDYLRDNLQFGDQVSNEDCNLIFDERTDTIYFEWDKPST